jgi:single-strand DNA-binding protein
MYDTTVTLVGNALNAPELRQTNGTGTNVASFRVASTSRKFDRDSGRWVDGPSLRVRVTCWRRLAESVQRCVFTGDPVIVTGRMYTRDWIADDGQHRVSYELEAVAVGHDLSRGQSTFSRFRPSSTTSAVEDAESDARVRGEASRPVAPSRPRDGSGDPAAPSRDAGDGPDSFGDPVEGYGGGFGRDEHSSFGRDESTSLGVGDADDAFGMLTDEDRATAADDAAEVFRAAGLTPEVTPDGAGDTTATAGRDGDDKPGDDNGAGGPRRRGRSRVPQPA